MKYSPIILLLLSGVAFGDEAVDCSVMTNTQDRLACFDRLFPGAKDDPATEITAPSESAPSISPPVTTAVPTTPTPNDVPPVQEAASVMLPTAIVTAEPEQPEKKSKKSWLGVFDRDDSVSFTATVTDVLNGEKQKMVFLLSNEQIWLQSTPRNLPIRRGDQVTIKNGTIGGYIMRTSTGTSTRVQRIN